MAKDDIPGERQRAFPRGRAKEQRLVQGLLSGRCGTRDMGGAGAVLTDFSIPAIAIARDPGIEFLRNRYRWNREICEDGSCTAHVPGAVLTDFSIPAIAIARDPGIEFLRHETNSWKKQDPGIRFVAQKFYAWVARN